MNTNKETPKAPKKKNKVRIITGWVLFIFSIILTISFVSYLFKWQEDQSQSAAMFNKSVQSSNVFGKLGDWLGNLFIYESFGIAAFFIAFLFFLLSSVFFKTKLFKFWKAVYHSVFFLLWLPVFIATVTGGSSVLSGVYGYEMYEYGESILGSFGLWLILLSVIILYLILEFNFSFDGVKSKLNDWKEKAEEQKNKIKDVVYDNDDPESKEPVQGFEGKVFENSPAAEPIKIPDNKDVGGNDNEAKIIVPINIQLNHSDDEPPTAAGSTSIPRDEEPKGSSLGDIPIVIEPIHSEEDDKEEEPAPNDLVEKHGLYDHRLDLAKFQMPTIELLKDYGNQEITISQEELEESKKKIEDLLKNFNVGIANIHATVGPTVILYELIPEVGVRVSTIKRLQDDIALNLAALGIRIIAPMPGKGTIGIEVPRSNPAMVSMRSVIDSSKFRKTDMELPVVFGRTISNEIFMMDLAKMPHLLMAGATGQGKSVGINAILASLLYKKHPSELKFVMVDPKKVELSLYAHLENHYLAKLPGEEDAVLTDTTKVINTLNSLCIEMDNRYDLLKAAFCRNLKEYNQKFTERKLNPENGHRYLPYIVLVVDEFADLIMTAGKEVEYPIARLAQLARAVGIHLIIATQRPSVNVITGMIKANFPARAAFRVISGVDSRTILDSPGAEQLIGKGDMLYFNGNDLTRLQCAFIDTPEVERIVEFISEQRGYGGAYELPEYVGEDAGGTSGDFDPNERDSLFEEAARIVVSTQQGSTSMLQRQLKLGYNRAGRIMDQLEANGIVGTFKGSKARDVLISDLNALEQFLEQMRN